MKHIAIIALVAGCIFSAIADKIPTEPRKLQPNLPNKDGVPALARPQTIKVTKRVIGPAVAEGRHVMTLPTIFSADAMRVAYGEESGHGKRVVVDGKPGQVYESIKIFSPQFSPDGKRFAYIGTSGGSPERGNPEKSFVVVDDEVKEVTGDCRNLQFSPDSAFVTFLQPGLNQRGVAGVVGDINEQQIERIKKLHSASRKDDLPTSYQKLIKEGKVESINGIEADRIRGYLVEAKEGHYAALVKQPGRHSQVLSSHSVTVLHNGHLGSWQENLTPPKISANGLHVIYFAMKDGVWRLTHDTTIEPDEFSSPYSVHSMAIGPKGQQMIYSGKKKSADKIIVYHRFGPEQILEVECEAVGHCAGINDNGTIGFFWVKREGKWRLYVNGRELADDVGYILAPSVSGAISRGMTHATSPEPVRMSLPYGWDGSNGFHAFTKCEGNILLINVTVESIH